MFKNIAKSAAAFIAANALITTPIALYAQQDSQSLAQPSTQSAQVGLKNWYLVDEATYNGNKNFKYQTLFANRASMTGDNTAINLNISDIEMSENKVEGKLILQIIDNRMNITVNCDENAYRINSLEQYNQDYQRIEEPEFSSPLNQWIEPSNQAYTAIITFACVLDGKKYQQPFGGNIQPLTGLISYLNADWSK